MPLNDELEPKITQRRNFLLRLLAAGAFVSTANLRAAESSKAPARSIHLLEGTVHVNGIKATKDTLITANDTIKTAKNGRIVFTVQHDAFILRNNSELTLSSNDLLVDSLRLLTGKMLAVFGKSKHQISTTTAVLGIRGTGVYVEASPELTYFCTCYGETEIKGINDVDFVETVNSKHHDAPKYITQKGEIKPAPFINHTDEELMLIESLVGRTTPFAAFDDDYSGPSKY
jgi:hypothetical protein